MGKVKNKHNLSLCPETNDPILTLEQVNLYLRLGDLCTEATFVVIEILSVNILIGHSLMDKYVKSINSTERRPKQLNSRSNLIISTGASDKLAIAATSSKEEKEHRIHASEQNITIKLRVTGQTSIKLHSIQKVLVVSTGQELIYFETDEK